MSFTSDMPRHKNKTYATFLAAIFGSIGGHRFYLRGMSDALGWAHIAALPLALMMVLLWPDQPVFFLALPVVVSALLALLEAIVIGLTPDEKWDVHYNPGSGRSTKSGWPLAALLVLTFGAGAIGLITVIARSFDLLFTGGAYG